MNRYLRSARGLLLYAVFMAFVVGLLGEKYDFVLALLVGIAWALLVVGIIVFTVRATKNYNGVEGPGAGVGTIWGFSAGIAIGFTLGAYLLIADAILG